MNITKYKIRVFYKNSPRRLIKISTQAPFILLINPNNYETNMEIILLLLSKQNVVGH